MDNLILTEKDKLVLESYKSVLEGLSEFLGSGFEMVLHSLEDADSSAIKVINGHFSGRKEGAPLTDLALRLLNQIQRSGNNHTNLVYFNRSKKGAPIRSATLPITGENDRIIGLLCMNFYMDIPLSTVINSLFTIDGNGDNYTETFVSSSEELLETAVEEARNEVFRNPAIPASNRNKEIIALLHEKNLFRLKDAVTRVADLLGISKNTVYLHLRNLQTDAATESKKSGIAGAIPDFCLHDIGIKLAVFEHQHFAAVAHGDFRIHIIGAKHKVHMNIAVVQIDCIPLAVIRAGYTFK